MITVRGRTLIIPESEKQIGTTYDNNSEVRHIRISRVTSGGIDIANLNFRLDLEYADKVLDTCLLDVEVGEEYILLTWTIPDTCIAQMGTVWIAVRAYDENGTVKWATNRGFVYVGHTIFDGDRYTGKLTELEQLEERIRQRTETLDANEGERQEAESQRQLNEEARLNNEAEWQRQAETAITEANTTLGMATEKAEIAKREAATATAKAKEAGDSAEAAGLSKDKAEMAANTAVTKAQEVQTNVDAAVELKELSLQAAITATDKAAESNASAERAESSTTLILQAEATVTKTAEQVKADAKTAADSRDIAVSEATKATEKASQADVSAKEVQRIVEGLGGFDGTAEHVSAVDTQGININTATGTTQVTVSDAWEAPIPGLEIAGKSEQGADPSPDNPQEIVSTDVTAVTVKNKNLTGPLENGSVDASGNEADDKNALRSGWISINPGKTYTFSRKKTFAEESKRCMGRIYDIDKNFLGSVTIFNNTELKKVISNSFYYSGARYIRLVQFKGNDETYDGLDLQMEEGDTVTDYEPPMLRTAAITLTEPLRGIGDVRDRIMCKDGVWGIERNISMDILTEDTVRPSAGGMNSTYPNCIIDNRYTVIYSKQYSELSKKGLYSDGKKTTGYCNIAPAGMVKDWSVVSGGLDNVYSINGLGGIYIAVPITVIGVTATATMDEVNAAIKQYVADNDVYVMFVLDAPTWEPLPAAAQSALNALTTYTGQTTITVTADGPEPDIIMRYYGQPGAKTNVQSMLDSLARKVALELVSNSDLAQLLSGYLAKSCIKNTGLVTEEGFVADARQLNPEIADTLAAKVKKNAEDIVTVNSNLSNKNIIGTYNIPNITGVSTAPENIAGGYHNVAKYSNGQCIYSALVYVYTSAISNSVIGTISSQYAPKQDVSAYVYDFAGNRFLMVLISSDGTIKLMTLEGTAIPESAVKVRGSIVF